MTAPALVLLAHGSADSSVTDVVHSMRVGMQQMRPELSIHAAFLDQCPPTSQQVISRIARTGCTEVVFVPLNLSTAFHEPAAEPVVRRVQADHPDIRFIAARPLGPEACLLGLMDRRLRSALQQAHATELDGLVLMARGAHDTRSQSLLSRRARQWSLHHKLPCVVATHDFGPTAAAAIQSLRAQGRRHIAVGSLFLTADDAYRAQADLARQSGAITVADPLGVEDEVLDLALGRYAVAAMELIDFGFDEHDNEEVPAPHLRVVGA